MTDLQWMDVRLLRKCLLLAETIRNEGIDLVNTRAEASQFHLFRIARNQVCIRILPLCRHFSIGSSVYEDVKGA